MENIPRNNLKYQVHLLEMVEYSWLDNFSDHFSFEIAFSGGMDSMVLLDAMFRLSQKYPLTLSAVHVHHGLQCQADKWVEFCTKVCQQYMIPLRVEYVSIDLESSLGIEGEARHCRYKAFQNTTQEVVVLAHHQNDQIETFLLAMLRGGGLRGMVSMPICRSLTSKIILWRPLLSVTQSEIARYAIENNLKYLEDPSNMLEDYTRNWIRQTLLPVIKNKSPFVEQHILKNISNLQDHLNIINQLRLEDYKKCVDNSVMFIKPLLYLSQQRAKEVILYFLEKNHLGRPRYRSINDFISWLFSAKLGDTYEWKVPSGRIYVYDQKIWPWPNDSELKKILETGYLTSSDIIWRQSKRGISQDFIQQSWTIRPMNKNDTIYTEIGIQSVFNLLKKNKIPDFIRQYWPVIVDANDECIIVVGLRINVNYQQDGGVVPIIKKIESYLN